MWAASGPVSITCPPETDSTKNLGIDLAALHFSYPALPQSQQPDPVIPLDRHKGQVAQQNQKAENQPQREGIENHHGHRAERAQGMIPFSPAGFQKESV